MSPFHHILKGSGERNNWAFFRHSNWGKTVKIRGLREALSKARFAQPWLKSNGFDLSSSPRVYTSHDLGNVTLSIFRR